MAYVFKKAAYDLDEGVGKRRLPLGCLDARYSAIVQLSVRCVPSDSSSVGTVTC